MKCGVSSRRKHIRVGYGMRLTMAVARYWRMSLGGGKIAFFCNCKRCWSPLASRGIHRWVGGLRAACRDRAAHGGEGKHAENREQAHQLARADQAISPSDDLFFQDRAHARLGDWALHQSL